MSEKTLTPGDPVVLEFKTGDPVAVERCSQVYAVTKVQAVLVQKIPKWREFDWIVVDEEGQVYAVPEDEIKPLKNKE